MKLSHLFLPILFMLLSCSSDDTNYANINGKVQRSINGDGIANQSIIVMTRQHTGSGWLSTIKELDRAEVITDANGNFSADLITDADAFVTVVHQGDDDYAGSGIFRDYTLGEPIIIETDKFIKFKVSVKNTNPIDENDFIKIDFYNGLMNVTRTKIENFGVANTYHPEEQLPGGGIIGAWEETSWTGMDVNSTVYYSVPETSEHFKIRWFKKKGGIDTDGFTDNIPYDSTQLNSFSFEY